MLNFNEMPFHEKEQYFIMLKAEFEADNLIKQTPDQESIIALNYEPRFISQRSMLSMQVAQKGKERGCGCSPQSNCATFWLI